GLGHVVAPADWLTRIAHDPQHVCEWQLAGCGCFLPHLLVRTASRSLRAASARPFSTVSVHRAIAQLIENRGPCISGSGSLVLQHGRATKPCFFCPPHPNRNSDFRLARRVLKYLILNHVLSARNCCWINSSACICPTMGVALVADQFCRPVLHRLNRLILLQI